VAGSDPDIREAIKKALVDGEVVGASMEDLRERCGLNCTNRQFSRALGSLEYNTEEVVSHKDPRDPDAKITISLTQKGRASMRRP
jgi:hypothetical protein